jgi:hypothetical protein
MPCASRRLIGVAFHAGKRKRKDVSLCCNVATKTPEVPRENDMKKLFLVLLFAVVAASISLMSGYKPAMAEEMNTETLLVATTIVVDHPDALPAIHYIPLIVDDDARVEQVVMVAAVDFSGRFAIHQKEVLIQPGQPNIHGARASPSAGRTHHVKFLPSGHRAVVHT